MKLEKFRVVAQAVATFSKDPSTKVGAVVVDDDGNVLSVGYNGFPRGVDDRMDRYLDRNTKLQFISHAESNAIAQAARNGVRLMGSTLVLTSLFPCSNCAKQIVQAGIRRVFAPVMDRSRANPHWFAEQRISEIMFAESGVEVIYLDEDDHSRPALD